MLAAERCFLFHFEVASPSRGTMNRYAAAQPSSPRHIGILNVKASKDIASRHPTSVYLGIETCEKASPIRCSQKRFARPVSGVRMKDAAKLTTIKAVLRLVRIILRCLHQRPGERIELAR